MAFFILRIKRLIVQEAQIQIFIFYEMVHPVVPLTKSIILGNAIHVFYGKFFVESFDL